MAKIHSSSLIKSLPENKIKILQNIRINGMMIAPTTLPSDIVIGGISAHLLLDKELQVKIDKDVWVITGIY